MRGTVKAHISNEATDEETLPKISLIPDEELVTLEEVTVRIPETDMPGPPRERAVCDSCGERVVDGRHVNMDGKLLCRACAGGGYYQRLG